MVAIVKVTGRIFPGYQNETTGDSIVNVQLNKIPQSRLPQPRMHCVMREGSEF